MNIARPGTRSKAFKYLPYAILWMILFLVLFEILTRLFWHPTIVGDKLYSRFAPDYGYGYNANRPLFFRDVSALVCYPMQYMNIHKQRIPGHRSKNDIRIFTFGGSVSRGTATANYSLYMETLLSSIYADKSIHVVNLSADGYGSRRILLLLSKSLDYAPDLVILHLHGSNEYEDERDFDYMSNVNSGVKSIIYSSNFLVILKKVFSLFVVAPHLQDMHIQSELEASRDPVNLQRWDTIIERNLFTMLNMLKTRNIPTIVVGRAERNDLGDGYESARAYSLNSIFRKQSDKSAYYFDTPYFLKNAYSHPAQKQTLFIDNSHWSSEGHRLVSEALTMFIYNHSLLN